MSQTDPVIIVGGGWAGIAAAVELARHDIRVILLESAKQLGGRARSIITQGVPVDNGQHLMLGAYESTLAMLRTLGVTEESVILRQPLQLHWLQPQRKNIHVKTAKLPAPMHLAWALLSAQGLNLKDRISALRFSHAMQKIGFQLEEDCSVLNLLERYKQSARLVSVLWQPLCLAALNTPIREASAQVFLRTIGDAFRYTRRDSDLLLTRRVLGSILPEPAMDYIEMHGGNVRLGKRVTDLLITDDAMIGVQLDDEKIFSPHVILATPHITTQRLLQPHTSLEAVSSTLSHIEDSPICTVYVQYAEDTKLEHPMQGVIDTISQWIFDRRIYGQHGLMAVVISAHGPHMAWDNQTLCNKIAGELADLYPHWPLPKFSQVVREKRATFASTVNINQLRPATQTPVQGLWLAGDYTDVGLPATLEGAVRSGLQSAKYALRQIRQSTSPELPDA